MKSSVFSPVDPAVPVAEQSQNLVLATSRPKHEHDTLRMGSFIYIQSLQLTSSSWTANPQGVKLISNFHILNHCL